MTLKDKIIWLVAAVLVVMVVKYSDTVAKVFWAFCQGAAAIKG